MKLKNLNKKKKGEEEEEEKRKAQMWVSIKVGLEW